MSHDHRWEDSLDELCASPEEAASLKETVSLFSQLPETHCSSSFRDELKQKLLLQAAEQVKKRQPQRRVISVLEGLRNLSWRHSRSLGLVAAAVLLVFFAGSVLNNPATDPGKPEVGGTENREGLLLSESGGYLPEGSDTSPADTPVDSKPDLETEDQSQGGEVEDVGEKDPITPAEEGRTSPGSSSQQQSDPAIPAGGQQDEDSDDVIPLPDEPDFEVYKNRRIFTVAGNIVLNYGSAADEYHSLENVKYNWEPNKYALATDNGYTFGTWEWARQLLTDEGFRVTTRDTLKVTMQETVQGQYAEIFYQVSPALVLHVHEDNGIIAYYYEEKSDVAPQGFYPLLEPANALNQQFVLKSSIKGQQLQFSFREVRFTYHDFLVEKDGTQEKMRLPAYRFIGDEMHQGKQSISFYVPAV